MILRLRLSDDQGWTTRCSNSGCARPPRSRCPAWIAATVMTRAADGLVLCTPSSNPSGQRNGVKRRADHSELCRAAAAAGHPAGSRCAASDPTVDDLTVSPERLGQPTDACGSARQLRGRDPVYSADCSRRLRRRARQGAKRWTARAALRLPLGAAAIGVGRLARHHRAVRAADGAGARPWLPACRCAHPSHRPTRP